MVHGLQVLAFPAPGATMFPHVIGEVFIAFTEQSCKFLKEVHSGDTLYPGLEIIDLTDHGGTGTVTTAATVYNQRGNWCFQVIYGYAIQFYCGQVLIR